MKHFLELEELVTIARGRDKARIGLPPGIHDASATAVFIIGTAADFRLRPVIFDRIISTDTLIDLDVPVKTEQITGIIDDQIVVKITIPDVPNVIQIAAEIHGSVTLYVIVGGWFGSRLINQLIFNQVVIEVQLIRLARAQRLAASPVKPLRAVARAQVRTARINAALTKRAFRSTTLRRRLLSPLRFVGRIGVRVAFKVFLIVGLAIDIVIIGHSVIEGSQRAGIAGGLGAFVGGVADALTLGLLEDQTTSLGETVESAISNVGQISLFSGLGNKVSLGTGN